MNKTKLEPGLPELPKPDIVVTDTGTTWSYATNSEVEGVNYFNADQMRAYALSAIAADRKREGELERLTHERNTLAAAIRDAAVKAGICRADVDLTGPHLLMLCDDMADCISAAPVSAGLSDQDVLKLAKERFGWVYVLGGFEDAIKDFARALSSRLPPDWVAVPREPTEEMLKAAERVEWVNGSGLTLAWVIAPNVYRAMIAAAPSLQPMPKEG